LQGKVPDGAAIFSCTTQLVCYYYLVERASSSDNSTT
jgi:hypothetical protein